MKVKCLGFSITNENENINTADVFAKFITSSERVHHGTDQSRQILMKDDGDFYSGLVLTYRNQKKNCKSKIENGKFQLKVEDLTGDEKLVSFNFFSLKKSNLKGLFMYHYGSCPISGLFNNLQTMSNEHIREQNKLEIEQLGTKPKQKHIKAVNKKYNKRLEFNILVTKKDVQSILSEFNKINSVHECFMDIIDLLKKSILSFACSQKDKCTILNISKYIIGEVILSPLIKFCFV